MKKIIFFTGFFSLLVSCNLNDKEAFKNIKSLVLENAVLSSGKLIRVDSFPSKFIESRPVDVWIPENYSSEKKYVVLYMHDGQNLFDATTTWNQQEWMIDEVATKLMKDEITKNFIVVGIHNIPAIRWQDLYPEKAMNFLSKEDKDTMHKEAAKNNFSTVLNGDAYLSFIVTELKPYIDATYAVYTNRENTFVAGSSMGGLMSMYAVAEYPEVFVGAACISTHWVGGSLKENNPLPDTIFKHLESNLPSAENHKMYFDYGNKTLDQFYPQYASRVDSIFLKNGYNTENFKNLFFEGTDHSELSWQKRVRIPLTFLLKK
jgi:predicted alpha/beta superfamily hydrolase